MRKYYNFHNKNYIFGNTYKGNLKYIRERNKGRSLGVIPMLDDDDEEEIYELEL